MAKPPKIYNNKQWTQARFNSFVKGALRSASNRWGPKFSILKKARVERGKYRCAGYNRPSHIVGASVLVKDVRKKNILVDHIVPIIDPVVGFSSWDDTIKRMFVEEDGLQALCKACHDAKTKDERNKRNEAPHPNVGH